jgi:hypothetical protein
MVTQRDLRWRDLRWRDLRRSSGKIATLLWAVTRGRTGVVVKEVVVKLGRAHACNEVQREFGPTPHAFPGRSLPILTQHLSAAFHL